MTGEGRKQKMEMGNYSNLRFDGHVIEGVQVS